MGLRQVTRFALATFAAGLALAQEAPPPPNGPISPGEDPPGRAGRLSFLAGTVSFQPGGVEDWVPATPNRPLTTGDRLWTEPGARAEVQTSNAALRLNARTNFTFLNLNDTTTQIQISSGTLGIRLRRLDQNEVFEIDTPQTAFTLLRPGEYRVDVNDQGDTSVVTVRGGQAEAVATDNRVVPLGPRTQARIAAAGDTPPVIDTRDAPVGDAFDNFCQDRDRREDRSESARHLSREIPGYADLDDHGVWRETPDYGWVWTPRVEAGWAPYHYGHWAWISPWGWTWVDDAPWGFAPFHYGRWAFVEGAWVWVPGPPLVRPVYAPALVAWVGGPRFSVGLAIGGGLAAVGWFPLGPGEVWVPAYRASPVYFNRVNVSNTVIVNRVNITNVYNNVYVNKTTVNNVTYVNQRVNGAVTAVPQTALVSGRSVAQASVRVPQTAIEGGQVQQMAPVAPQREALLGPRQTAAAAPPAALNGRAMMARATPPPAPVPFARQQAALQANPGQPISQPSMRSLQPTTPVPQRAQIRQVTAPPPSVPATVAPPPQQPAAPRSTGERPALRTQERPANGPPPVTGSSETVRQRPSTPPVNPIQPRPGTPAVTQPQPPNRVQPTPQARPETRNETNAESKGGEARGKERRPEKRPEAREGKQEEKKKE